MKISLIRTKIKKNMMKHEVEGKKQIMNPLRKGWSIIVYKVNFLYYL